MPSENHPMDSEFPQHWHNGSGQRNSDHSESIDGWSGVGGTCLFTTGGTTCLGNRAGGEHQPIDWEKIITQPKDHMRQNQLIVWKDIHSAPSEFSYFPCKGIQHLFQITKNLLLPKLLQHSLFMITDIEDPLGNLIK